jgi:hypothetical protein
MIAFIDDHREVYGVEPICRILRIAPSTYHAPQRSPHFIFFFAWGSSAMTCLTPIILFQRRGFHGAVMVLAATGFVVLRIEDG